VPLGRRGWAGGGGGPAAPESGRPTDTGRPLRRGLTVAPPSASTYETCFTPYANCSVNTTPIKPHLREPGVEQGPQVPHRSPEGLSTGHGGGSGVPGGEAEGDTTSDLQRRWRQQTDATHAANTTCIQTRNGDALITSNRTTTNVTTTAYELDDGTSPGSVVTTTGIEREEKFIAAGSLPSTESTKEDSLSRKGCT